LGFIKHKEQSKKHKVGIAFGDEFRAMKAQRTKQKAQSWNRLRR
jgi:hypothetical protein